MKEKQREVHDPEYRISHRRSFFLWEQYVLVPKKYWDFMGTEFLTTALLGNDNTSLSCIDPVLKSLAIHLGNPKSRQFVPIYHSCLLEIHDVYEITIMSLP